MSPLLWPT